MSSDDLLSDGPLQGGDYSFEGEGFEDSNEQEMPRDRHERSPDRRRGASSRTGHRDTRGHRYSTRQGSFLSDDFQAIRMSKKNFHEFCDFSLSFEFFANSWQVLS